MYQIRIDPSNPENRNKEKRKTSESECEETSQCELSYGPLGKICRGFNCFAVATNETEKKRSQ